MVSAPVSFPRALSATVIADLIPSPRRNSRSSGSWASSASSASPIRSRKRGPVGGAASPASISRGSEGRLPAMPSTVLWPPPGPTRTAIRSTWPSRIRSITQKSAISGTMISQIESSVSRRVPPPLSEILAIRLRTSKRRIALLM